MIPPELPTLKAAIRIIGDYGDAKEYVDPDPNFGYNGEFGDAPHTKVRRYIESKDNAEFEVVISIEDHQSLDQFLYRDDGLQFTLFVDGEYMGKRFVQAHVLSQRKKGYWTTTFVGKKSGGQHPDQTVLRRFVFAPMSTVEDNTTDAEIQRSRALGTIEVVVRTARFMGIKHYRGSSRRHRAWDVTDHDDMPGYPFSEISEKALKGRSITHSIAYSPPEHIESARKRDTRLDSEVTDQGRPLASLLFKYRSYEGLKREGVIPRTPPPNYRDVVPKAEELSQHELARLARKQLRQMKRAREEAHPDSQSAPDGPTSLGKRTHDVHDLTGDERQPKMPRIDPSQVIDLTQDDDDGLEYDVDNDVIIADEYAA